ncbi:MAG: mandelate racemase/muconate lactonizing enzyme family protein [Hydrogenophaga sp.]|jgi:L-rhamnonate dehydratase|uniref:mandelate racemase/muconate lactonizing enzyme family protein n=1 Tax=Hydrogenophaga sp. TaxID=1904254 RepID=UPI002621FC5D|nr:mandelate racemase/muconate lactonizing enzyme family protein [Hydrogenophaga sp.]MCW5668797.1 mandelate racemase/muconate lactonizing enzyme family protein [Hydrogenophaga sp.]
MKIIRITATALHIPFTLDVPGGGTHQEALGCCVVEVETDEGLIGHGLTAITQEKVAESIITHVLAPALIGTDPLAHEARWEQMYWLTASRGQTGYAQHAIAAIDVALWDLKGKALRQPIWRLLGAARKELDIYATFGFEFLDIEGLRGAVKSLATEGVEHLKMVVGFRALPRRESRSLMAVIQEDAKRVRAVREAAGDEVSLYIDANCGLDAYHAERLIRLTADCHLGFFEEPVTQNDVLAMADLRARTGMPLTCGQNEGLAYRFRDWLMARSVDFVQPNVVITGGFTQCVRIAALANAFNVSITSGGAYPLHNMHLQAGVGNGTKVEWHLPVVAMMKHLYRGFPEPVGGRITMSEAPGLGFDLIPGAVQALRA